MSCLSTCSAKSGDGWENSPHQSSLPWWQGRAFAFLIHLVCGNVQSPPVTAQERQNS